MADTRDIRITIVGESGDKLPEEEGKGKAEEQKEELSNNKMVSSIFRKIAPSVTTATLIGQGVSIVKQTTQFAINEYLNLTDNYVVENNFAIVNSVISKSASALTSIMGATMAFGPIGTAVSVAIQGVTLGIDIAKNYHNQAVSVRIAETNLDYQRVRAGYSLTAGSVGENK